MIIVQHPIGQELVQVGFTSTSTATLTSTALTTSTNLLTGA